MQRKRGNESTSYIGVDESNHGRFPEIFVAVYSTFESDLTVRKDYVRITKPDVLFPPLAKREWRYLIASDKDYEALGPHELKVCAVASLINGLNPPGDFLEVFVDGELQRREMAKIKRELVRTLRLTPFCINISPLVKNKKATGRKYQETNYITLLADSVASYLYRRKTLEELTAGRLSRRRVPLVYFND
jgi:hypothetical protein